MVRGVMRNRAGNDSSDRPGSMGGSGSSEDSFFKKVLSGDPEGPGASEALRRRPARRYRGRRWAVALLVLVVVLCGGAVGAEFLVRGQIDSAVRSALPGLSSDARISTRGIVLTQLVGGSLDSLSVDSKSLEVTSKGQGGAKVALSDVDIDLSRISLSKPYPTDTVTVDGTVSWKQVAELAAKSHPSTQGVTLQAKQTGTSAQQPGVIGVSVSLLGASGEVEIVPSITADGRLVLTITSTQIGGEQAGTDVDTGESGLLSYVGLDSPEITVPVESLPQGLRPTSAIVTEDGLRLSLAGSRVNLGQL